MEATVAGLFREITEMMQNSPMVSSGAEEARQMAIARTEFESGFMRLRRAIVRPPSPWAKSA